MRFDPSFLDEIRARVGLGDLVGRHVKLTRAGRELKGLCPFHNEKTPSFSVVEEKGFYHCFGCGAHGSHFDFLMQKEGLSFPEAVERLAGEAGLPMPAPDPEAKARADRAQSLYEIIEIAAAWFEAQLATARGRDARAYLDRRGVQPATRTAFRLGYAPADRRGLKDALAARSVPVDKAVEAGLLIRPDAGGEPYDRFRNRLIFPIDDGRGRVIAFGGRALDPDARAKYLNSPETPLFHKGRTLYNLHRARKAAHDRQRVIAVEGYMDVIALAQAGFAEAVAPLGTALTEEQLTQLWRLAPEPMLCFDGDKAGLRAVDRALDRALRGLKPGVSLRFALLPEGLDPDDLIRRDGPAALESVLNQALPLSDLVWRLAVEHQPMDTPERRAGVERALFDRLAAIGDEKIRRLYQSEMAQRLRDLDWARRRSRSGRSAESRWPGPRRSVAVPGPATALPLPGLAHADRIILRALIHHPELLVRHEEAIAALTFSDERLDRLRQLILRAFDDAQGLDRDGLQDHLRRYGASGAAQEISGAALLRRIWWTEADAALSDAEIGLASVLKLRRRAVLEQELASLRARPIGEWTEPDLTRLQIVTDELHHLREIDSDSRQLGLASGRESDY